MSDADAKLPVEDPLAHRALDALVRAASVTRRLGGELERAGVSATGFAVLVLLTSAGGEIELRVARKRLGISKANATEVLDTLVTRGFVTRSRLSRDRRAVSISLTPAGRALVTGAFPGHAERVSATFGVLEDDEKRTLAQLLRKLERAA